MIEKICEICSKPFQVRNYRKDTARFCSLSCKSSWAGQQEWNKRPKPYMIGNQYGRGRIPTNAFQPGPRGPQVERLEYQCEECGKDFYFLPWQRKSRGQDPRFCSRACFCRSGCFQGDKSVHYLGPPTLTRTRSWFYIRKEVVAAQNEMCGHCGEFVGPSMPVHHVKPFRYFRSEEEANVRTNLVGLCSACHGTADQLLKSKYRELMANDPTFSPDDLP